MSHATQSIDQHPRNAAVSWALITIVTASVGESLLEGTYLWAGFYAVVVGVAVAPAVVARSPTVLVSWEILLLSALPAITQLVDVFVRPLTYLAIAALALLVVTELDAFTAARLTTDFAAFTVVLTTLSVASTWTIAQYASDVALGTSYLGEMDAVMWDLVIASGVGVAAGALFALYCAEQSLPRVLDGEA